uniref:ATP synthase subunit b, chloroplastic n=1 Tax=Phacus orbicularis TaxID=158829 RepID=A0A172F0V6_9EUGL|nr:ATPase subunit I [Phacus orbicularis]
MNFLFSISHSEGFGINTDIFETNIINLTVVIGVLIYYGKSLLSTILQERKESIVKNLQETEKNLKEASENLKFAKDQFELAKQKAEEIKLQGFSLANQTTKKIMELLEEDIKRLKESTLSTLKFEEEKLITEVCQKLNNLAFIKAVEILKKRINLNIQNKIIFQSIEKLSVFKSK